MGFGVWGLGLGQEPAYRGPPLIFWAPERAEFGGNILDLHALGRLVHMQPAPVKELLPSCDSGFAG